MVSLKVISTYCVLYIKQLVNNIITCTHCTHCTNHINWYTHWSIWIYRLCACMNELKFISVSRKREFSLSFFFYRFLYRFAYRRHYLLSIVSHVQSSLHTHWYTKIKWHRIYLVLAHSHVHRIYNMIFFFFFFF